MTLEEYDIVKLHDKINNRDLYVAVVNVKNNIAKVRLLNQPSYELHTTMFADNIFMQYCHCDDEVYQQPLKFNKDRFTFEISESMWQPVNRNERIKVIGDLVYTIKDGLISSLIVNELEKLRYL